MLRCTAHLISSLFSTIHHSALLGSSHPTPLLSSPSPILSSHLEGKVSRLSYESPRIVLLKMLDGTAATLRTNFFNEDRYALSLRVSLSHADTDTDPHADTDSDSAVNLNLLLSSLPSNLTLLHAHHSHPVPSGSPFDHDEWPHHCIETHALRGVLLPR
jgi:hypothetical protein